MLVTILNLSRRVSVCAHPGPSLHTQALETPYRFTYYKTKIEEIETGEYVSAHSIINLH